MQSTISNRELKKLCDLMPAARPPAAAHTRPAERRARAGFLRPCRASGAPRLLHFARHRLYTRTHFVERRFVRCGAFACAAGAMRRDFVVERDAHFVERRLVDFALFPSPRCAGRGSSEK